MNGDPELLHPSIETLLPLVPGTLAPDFTLHSTPDETVSLHDFRGQPVILVFYSADWSPVSSDELTRYHELMPEISRLKAELLGISVDGAWSHLAFAQHRQFLFPLLSDFEPKGVVARTYGVFRAHEGTCSHALFVLDEEGIIRMSHVYPPVSMNPVTDDLLNVLEQFQDVQRSEEMKMLPRLTMPVSERDHIQGPTTAEVTLVEYGDHGCPYCTEAYPVVKEIQRQLGSKLRFVFRHYSQSHIHPHARHAAKAAEAASAQDMFWEMHGVLFEHQHNLLLLTCSYGLREMLKGECKDVGIDERREPTWRCVAGHVLWKDNTFRFQLVGQGSGNTYLRFWQDYAVELDDDSYGTYNFNWGYYLESLRLFCTLGIGKPFHSPP
jgi:peroxiredoxin